MSTLPQAEVICRREAQVRLQLQIPARLDVFRGHFPGFAILPGVAQVDWAIRFARAELGLATAVRHIEQLKFQCVIRGGLPLVLDLERRDDDNVQFRYRSAGTLCSAGIIRADGYERVHTDTRLQSRAPDHGND